MRRIPFAFENLRVGRDADVVAREVRALANQVNRDTDRARPKVLALCESLGYSLPVLPGYSLVHDRSTPSRANLALYVLAHLDRGPVRWLDLDETWPRTAHDGRHEPRSILYRQVGGVRVVVTHAPPAVPGAFLARSEWIRAMRYLMREPTRTLVLGDPNKLNARIGNTPGVRRAGTGTDAVFACGMTLTSVNLTREVNGVPIRTDHRHALLGKALSS